MVKYMLRRFGILRLILLTTALVTILLMPFVDITAAPSGWGLISSAVLPALAPMVVMILMLDLIMCQVLKHDADPQRKRDLNVLSVLYAVLIVAVFFSWVPIFLKATYF